MNQSERWDELAIVALRKLTLQDLDALRLTCGPGPRLVSLIDAEVKVRHQGEYNASLRRVLDIASQLLNQPEQPENEG